MINFMPSRFYKGGAGSGSGKTDPMNVPYDEWGEMIGIRSEGDGVDTVYLEDQLLSILEEDIFKTTKKEVIDTILAWRDDDGLWSDEDMAGYIAYKDGRFIDVKDLNGKSFPRQGIIGAYFSGPDDQMAWGHEWARSGGQLRQVPMTVTSEDGREFMNTHIGAVTTGMYRVRRKTSFYRDGNKVRTKRETIRQSTVKSTGHRGRNQGTEVKE